LEEAGDFLLAIYRSARELPAAEFRAQALKRLQGSLPLMSAVWGDARRVPNSYAVVPTSLEILNLDAAFLVEWARCHHRDATIPLLLSNPSRALRVHIPSFYAGQPDLLDFVQRNEIDAMNLILVNGLAPGEIHWLSLYRQQRAPEWSELDCKWLELMMPHLTEAARINVAIHPSDLGNLHELNVAVAEAASCTLLRADTQFLAVLACEWSGFDGLHLPPRLAEAWRHAQTFVHLGKRIRIDGRCFGELVYLCAREKNQVESLTQRQLEVAHLYAKGLTSKEIAQACALSPATVRNHMAHVFEALQLHSRQELSDRLRQQAT
jgi:DNA-binding CsgD family transcriptional regulator